MVFGSIFTLVAGEAGGRHDAVERDDLDRRRRGAIGLHPGGAAVSPPSLYLALTAEAGFRDEVFTA
jgi:hypothetical protein